MPDFDQTPASSKRGARSETTEQIPVQQSTVAFRPLYEQIIDLVTKALIAGEWKPGEAIPSEFELAKRFGVSQGTVRKAIDELASRYILIRRQGKGTYVATHQEANWQYRFLRMLPDAGVKTYPASEFLSVRIAGVKRDAAAALKLEVGAQVASIRRVLRFEGVPMILDEMVLRADRVEGINLGQVREFEGSMYSFYERSYGIRMIRASERLKAISANDMMAQHLEVDVGTPLLCVDRIACTYDDEPVEWRRGICRTDGYSYVNELS
jgi:GntR family transcriptional regulator